MTQRYPLLFDGVISGAPAMRTGYSNLADRFIATMLNSVAPKNDAGIPITARALSDSDKKLFMNALLESCDDRDGLKDGMIWNVKGCRFEPETLICGGEKTDQCLTRDQVAAIKKGFAGPRTLHGEAVYSGFAFDTGITASGPGQIPGLLNPGPSPVGPPNTDTKMDVDAAAAVVEADQMARLTDSTWTNLTTFSGHGGKLIFFHGVSDPWFSALDTLSYFERMERANGGADQAAGWSRFYNGPRHGSLWRRTIDAGQLRHSLRASGLGGALQAAGLDPRHRQIPPRPQPAALRLAHPRPLQRSRRFGKGRKLRVPSIAGGAMADLELVALIVRDYDPAIRFFVDVLQFELVEDAPSLTNDGRPKRWVVVRPAGARTGILLARADGDEQASAVGQQFAGRVGLFLRVDDFEASYQRMVAGGVRFVKPPRTEPYGQVAVFLDLEGNRWDLLGPRVEKVEG